MSRKPPGPNGTTSQERATRYLNAAGGSQSKDSEAARTPAGARSGRGAPSGIGHVAKKLPSSAAGAAEPEDEVELDDDFASSWNYFERHESLPGGSLRKIGHGGPLAGMTHPPQNPKVQKELMRYFQKLGTPAVLERREMKIRPRPDVAALCEEANPASPLPAGSARSLGSPARSVGSPSSLKGGGKQSMSSTWSVPWAPDQPMPGGRGMTRGMPSGCATPPKAFGSSAELWAELKDLHSHDQAAPPPVSYLELGRWSRELFTKSRFHGFDLSQRTTEDVSDLAMYHNSLSRSAVSPKKDVRPITASLSAPELGRPRPRDLSFNDSTGFGRRTATGSFGSQGEVSKQPFHESLQSVRSFSSEKLREKAQAVLRAGPSRVQFLSEVARVSMATGATPHRSRDDWLYGPAPAAAA